MKFVMVCNNQRSSSKFLTSSELSRRFEHLHYQWTQEETLYPTELQACRQSKPQLTRSSLLYFNPILELNGILIGFQSSK